jgi:hypothetical protein
MDGATDERMDRWTDGRVDGWTDRRMDEAKERRIDGTTDGLMSLGSYLITDLLSILKDQLAKCNEECSSIFAVASDVLSQLDVPIELPRITIKRQKHRSNAYSVFYTRRVL